jgi:hypothetical protein
MGIRFPLPKCPNFRYVNNLYIAFRAELRSIGVPSSSRTISPFSLQLNRSSVILTTQVLILSIHKVIHHKPHTLVFVCFIHFQRFTVYNDNAAISLADRSSSVEVNYNQIYLIWKFSEPEGLNSSNPFLMDWYLILMLIFVYLVEMWLIIFPLLNNTRICAMSIGLRVFAAFNILKSWVRTLQI